MGSPRVKLTPLVDGPVRNNVRSCLKALPWLASKVRAPAHVDRRDLAQDAYFVLHRCAEKYDRDVASFATYAIDSARLNMRSRSLMYRCVGTVPRLAATAFRKIERENKYAPTHVIDARLDELRALRHVATYGDDECRAWWDARAYFTWKFGERSLSEVVGGSDRDAPGENIALEDTIASDDLSPEESAADIARKLLAAQMFSHAVLTPREKDILRWRFVGDETLESIGDRLGCTREWVRRLEAKALAKLRPIAEELSGA